MGKSLPFCISVRLDGGVRLDGDIRKARLKIKKVGVTIRSLDTLLATTDFQKFVMDRDAIPLKLATRVDGLALTSVGILVHDGNYRTMLELNSTSNTNQWEISDLVVINTTHINLAGRGIPVNNLDIISIQATISTTVDKGTIR